MNTKLIVALTTLFLFTIVPARPLTKPNINLSHNTPSNFHKLIKRASGGEESSPKTGFAAIISTEDIENRQKNRECEEWEKEPITNKWKCIKFLVVSTKN